MPTLQIMLNTGELEEFVSQLRAAVDGYLQAVDAWENTYQKQYRLLDPPRLSADLEPFQEDYLAARRRLERLVPQARQLSRRYELPDPWAGLLHIKLGARTPQMGAYSAIGQGERAVLYRWMTNLEALSQIEELPEPERQPVPAPRGLLGRIFDFFF